MTDALRQQADLLREAVRRLRAASGEFDWQCRRLRAEADRMKRTRKRTSGPGVVLKFRGNND